MCTVTYIPTSNKTFLLTSNRDEAPNRSMPQLIFDEASPTLRLLHPKDARAGGTWLVATNNGTVACLLNGAFKKHHHSPPYRRSRGLMILDAATQYNSFENFTQHYDFEGIEPFTLVVCESEKVFELRWDEQQIFWKQLDETQPHIWASATLYTLEAQQKRRQWLADFIQQQAPLDAEKILLFHKTAGDGDTENDVIMNRNNFVKTVSITRIEKQAGAMQMRYEDLQYNTVSEGSLPLRVATPR